MHTTNDSISAWAHHIDGAVTLAKLRGPQQLEQESSRKLFQAVRAMMVRNNILDYDQILTQIVDKCHATLQTG